VFIVAFKALKIRPEAQAARRHEVHHTDVSANAEAQHANVWQHVFVFEMAHAAGQS